VVGRHNYWRGPVQEWPFHDPKGSRSFYQLRLESVRFDEEATPKLEVLRLDFRQHDVRISRLELLG
jgi:hypothetical protein